MNPYEVLLLDPDASFDDVVVAYRRLTICNGAIANRFAGQDSAVQQQRLDWARKVLEPLISTLAFVAPADVVAACEQLLESAIGPQSDLGECDWGGEGCS